uniref:Uncharacterized protein n=1 Tax=Tanacetum cinerariifolium TaxID=118510 RepID=A0A6L2LXE4_TANCI|nr:hypothetical protein [Tanacetum cinerariifolium]
MIDCMIIVETDKVNHNVEIDIVKLVVEIESFGMNADELDKETGSSDGLQPKQADLNCVHALNEPHLHEIHVVPSTHEADQYFPTFVYNMGKGLRNKKKPTKNYKMFYNGEGPSLTINRLKIQEDLTREELEADLYKRIMLLNEKMPIIKNLKYVDRHKMLLDSFLLDKLKPDGEFELEEEIVGKRVIREYKAIKEKENPRCFIPLIRLEGNIMPW